MPRTVRGYSALVCKCAIAETYIIFNHSRHLHTRLPSLVKTTDCRRSSSRITTLVAGRPHPETVEADREDLRERIGLTLDDRRQWRV